MFRQSAYPLIALLLCTSFGTVAAYEDTKDQSGSPFPSQLSWIEDYRRGTDLAEEQEKMLLIYFRNSGGSSACARFESEALSDSRVIEDMEEYVRVTLPLDATIVSGGKEMTLLRHASFSEMLGRPGVAIVDYMHKGTSNYGCVVSQFPFLRGRPYDARETHVILTLPEGSLTQRTLVYAVRTHPEAPASTDGPFSPYLAAEAEKHSKHQARIRRQGHHQWSTRFHRINARLGSGMLATEVCAESWPGESLVEAAVECVRCWRLSSGHWRSVRARNGAWGYDMKRGSNGIWYATGIFGR